VLPTVEARRREHQSTPSRAAGEKFRRPRSETEQQHQSRRPRQPHRTLMPVATNFDDEIQKAAEPLFSPECRIDPQVRTDVRWPPGIFGSSPQVQPDPWDDDPDSGAASWKASRATVLEIQIASANAEPPRQKGQRR